MSWVKQIEEMLPKRCFEESPLPVVQSGQQKSQKGHQFHRQEERSGDALQDFLFAEAIQKQDEKETAQPVVGVEVSGDHKQTAHGQKADDFVLLEIIQAAHGEETHQKRDNHIVILWVVEWMRGHQVVWDFWNQRKEEQTKPIFFPVTSFFEAYYEHKGKQREREFPEHQQ